MSKPPVRRTWAWLLIFALAFAGLLPYKTALAAEPFQFVKVTAYDGTQVYPIAEGTVIGRNVRSFTVTFNHDMDFTTTGANLIWTDSTGAPAEIRQEISYGAASNQAVRSPLKANETYTLTIRGGADGVKDAEGNTLPGDVSLRFKTDGSPLITTVSPTIGSDQYNIRQTDSFVFEAAAGQLKVAMGLADGAQYLVAVSGPAPDQVVGSAVLTSGKPETVINLPQAGQYSLVIGPLTNHTLSPGRLFEVTGPDLKMPGLTTPPLLVTDIARFETHNTPFDIDVQISSRDPYAQPVRAAQVAVMLDGKDFRENILGPEGTSGRISVDPATLSEGVHKFLFLAKSVDSENGSAVMRTMFVDRVGAFGDVPATHWARKPIEFMHDLGILNGQGDGLFAPGQPVTRAAFAKMLALTVKLPESTGTATFADVAADHWSLPYLQKLAGAGLLKGETVDGQTYMRPDRTITRAEAATIIGRVLGVAELDLAKANLDPSVYQVPDLNAIQDWAKPSVLVLKSRGWLTGYPDGRIGPGDTLNRDQAAKLISRFLGL